MVRLDSPIMEVTPCNGCTEKFTACHDRCPKDKRGEFGYGAWKALADKANKARKEYDLIRYEEKMRMRKIWKSKR